MIIVRGACPLGRLNHSALTGERGKVTETSTIVSSIEYSYICKRVMVTGVVVKGSIMLSPSWG